MRADGLHRAGIKVFSLRLTANPVEEVISVPMVRAERLIREAAHDHRKQARRSLAAGP
jgi:hypothetical protein